MKTFYEFFAGGGMARAGLGVDWQCLLANDFCPKKSKVYAFNWGPDNFIIQDINTLQVNDIPGHADLAWASFPCQDLSLAGAGAGLKGGRSGAFWGFWKIMQELANQGRKPHMVMLENVYGTLTSHEGQDFEAIAMALASTGYILGAMIIDAVHFVPQSRPRLFLLAVDAEMTIPHDIVSAIPNPAWHPASLIKAYNQLPTSIKDLWTWWNPTMPEQRLKTFDDIVESEPKGVKWHSFAETQRLLSMMSDINRRKVLTAQKSGMLKVGTLYKRTRRGIQRAEVRFDGISGCLRTPAGGSSRQTIVVVEGCAIKSRLISPREAARLMGLPDSYALPLRYNESYHLLGDGVVVPVVKHLATSLLSPILAAQNPKTVKNAKNAARI